MADEELASTEEAEALELAPDTEEETTSDDPIANLASELGWTPKDQWRGDPDKWRPADEFIRTGRDIQQTTARELKAMREQVERFGRVAADITQDRVRQTEQHWEQKLAEAVDAGDHEAVDKARNQLKRVEQSAAQPGPVPEVQEWVSRNTWFNSDALAASRAREVTDRLAREGHPVDVQLAEAEKAIRRERPDLFPTRAKDPPSTQTGQSRMAAPSNRAKGFTDMPAESQQMAKDMVRRNPSVTLEAIAKSYWSDVANQGRA